MKVAVFKTCNCCGERFNLTRRVSDNELLPVHHRKRHDYCDRPPCQLLDVKKTK